MPSYRLSLSTGLTAVHLQVVQTLGLMLAAMLDKRELPDMLDRCTMTAPDAPFLEDRTDLVWSILNQYYRHLELREVLLWSPLPDLLKAIRMPCLAGQHVSLARPAQDLRMAQEAAGPQH